MTGLEKLVSMVTNRSGKSRRRKQSSSNRFVVYYRVSTRQQGLSGLGLKPRKLRPKPTSRNVVVRSSANIGKSRQARTANDRRS